MTRRTITVDTFNMGAYEAWTPDDFLMKVAAAIALIPEKDRAEGGNGIVELGGDGDARRLRIQYNREENDEEYDARVIKQPAAAFVLGFASVATMIVGWIITRPIVVIMGLLGYCRKPEGAK